MCHISDERVLGFGDIYFESMLFFDSSVHVLQSEQIVFLVLLFDVDLF